MMFEEELLKLFEHADGVNDTIWYSDTETLYDAIVRIYHKDIRR